MIQMPTVHSPHSTEEISKSLFCQETDSATESADVIEYESAEEMMEETMEEEEANIENQTNTELDITESSGMRYDGDETTIEEEKAKPDGYMVVVCWIGLAYTGIHKLCSSKA